MPRHSPPYPERKAPHLKSLPQPPKEYDPRYLAEVLKMVENSFIEVGDAVNRFEFLYEFGRDGTPPVLNEIRARMLPRACRFVAWFVRCDTSDTVTLNMSFASGISGAANPVGGTQPFCTSSIGHGLNPLDWTINSGALGDVLLCELTGFNTAGYVAVSVICQG